MKIPYKKTHINGKWKYLVLIEHTITVLVNQQFGWFSFFNVAYNQHLVQLLQLKHDINYSLFEAAVT